MVKIIAVDIDDVLYNSRDAAIRRTNEDLNTNYDPGDSQWEFMDMKLQHAWYTLSHFYDPEFIVSIPMQEGAKEFIQALMEDYDVYLVSATFSEVTSARSAHISEALDICPSRIIYMKDKRLFKADLLIDDNPTQLDNFPNMTIKFNQPWNADTAATHSASTLKEVKEICDTILI